MFLRYKKWKDLGLNQVKKAYLPGYEYLFTKENRGVCDVTFKPMVDLLLGSRDGIPSEFEIAYEQYGIAWGPKGTQVDIAGAAGGQTDQEAMKPASAGPAQPDPAAGNNARGPKVVKKGGRSK